AATSADTLYSGMNPSDVAVINQDNDTSGFTVTPTSPPQTTEAGGTATYTVVLTSQPTGQVHVVVTSSNTSEGTITATTLTIKNSDWNVPQTITVTGVDDAVDDGDKAYNAVNAPATSTDP